MVKHRARKRFGQNFLSDQSIINSIINFINPKEGDNLVEIGPGLGALTYRLLELTQQCRAIEIDRDLIAHLRKTSLDYGQLEIIEADALTVHFDSLGNQLRVIGNLPYNISTPLILHLLDAVANIKDMHFMLQKEVVERLAAMPGSKDYGRLTVMVQYYYRVDKLLDVPPEAFEPSPKVDSAIVRLVPHDSPPFPAINRAHFQATLITAFNQRRKTVRNNFKGVLDEVAWRDLNIDSGLRPEALSVGDYVRINNYLNK